MVKPKRCGCVRKRGTKVLRCSILLLLLVITPFVCGFTTKIVVVSKSPTALELFRPDWMRRAGRIEEKRKERRAMHESLNKRRRDLGVEIDGAVRPRSTAPAPQNYRVVSSSSNKNTAENDDYDSMLKIYLFVPETEAEANDESNVLDSLEDGAVITSISTKKVGGGRRPPLRAAVLAASLIYNVADSSTEDTTLWIEHDQGGWSPSTVDGIRRLVPIPDDDDGGKGL